jgi:predicted amidophosphoribosyltransferase
MFSRALSEVLAVIAPPACAACRAVLARADVVVCGECLRSLPWLRGARCPRCALPAHGSPGSCPARNAAFVRAWSPLAYESTARELVSALKFGGMLPLADVMAAQLAATAPPGLLPASAVLVPVPLHPVRRRARGFDQALRLTSAVGRRTGLAARSCLLRRGPAGRQVGATRTQRRDPGRLCIEAVGELPAHAILVDDVYTTGATLDACAHVLRAGGVETVTAMTYARTL